MEDHYNIQMKVQRVSKPGASMELGNGKMYRTEAEKLRMAEAMERAGKRDIVDLITIAVSAGSEMEAYDKAAKLLQTMRPELPAIAAHQHRASCHGPIGELLCGNA
jgi:hypothetical protein